MNRYLIFSLVGFTSSVLFQYLTSQQVSEWKNCDRPTGLPHLRSCTGHVQPLCKFRTRRANSLSIIKLPLRHHYICYQTTTVSKVFSILHNPWAAVYIVFFGTMMTSLWTTYFKFPVADEINF